MKKIRTGKNLLKQNLVVLFILLIFVTMNQCSKADNKPAAEQWISLFNGQDLNDWKIKIAGYDLGDNYNNTFRVEDGLLKVSYDQYEKFTNQYGHIFYKEPFSNYRIRIEYRFIGEQAPGGEGWAFRNSGVMLHCQAPETMGKEQSFPVSIEAQFLGGNGTDERPTANLCTPGTNVVINGELVTTHCNNSTSPTFHGDQWVTMEAEVHGSGIIKHYMNGELVMQYEQAQYDTTDADAAKLVQGGNLLIPKGYISLQAESHPIEFRKVELLPLTE